MLLLLLLLLLLLPPLLLPLLLALLRSLYADQERAYSSDCRCLPELVERYVHVSFIVA